MKSLVDITKDGKSAFEETGLDARLTAVENEIMASDNIKTTATVALIANVAGQLPATPVANRKSVIFINTSDEDIWYGDSSVVPGAGTLLKPGEKNALNISTGLYAVAAAPATLSVNELY